METLTETLVDILKRETQSLKEQYIQRTQEWAINHFEMVSKRKGYTEVQWCKLLNLTPEPVNVGTSYEFLSFPKGFFNTKLSREYQRLKDEVSTLNRLGLEKYVQKEIESSIKHYNSSIAKLADRIEKKKLNQSTLTVKTAHINENIETTLTDGNRTVRAYTIIASGPIQRPHYRYLIK